MAFQIIKDPAFLKELPIRYQEYATVKGLQRTGLKKYLGPRAGTAWVSLPDGHSRPALRVVVPEWRGGLKNEWESLQQCYQKVLQLAREQSCGAVVIPLLEAGNPDFPASIDYKIAVDTLRDFSEVYRLDVYLTVFQSDAALTRSLRAEVERYLARQDSEPIFPGCSLPFADGKSRFDTITSLPQQPWEIVEEDLDEAILDWSAAMDCCSAPTVPEQAPVFLPEAEPEPIWEEEVIEDGCPYKSRAERYEALPRKSPAPKKEAARRPRPDQAKSFRQSTGSLPDLSGYLQDLDAGFSETLLQLIDKSGKKDSEIYNKANVSRQHFSKIRNNPGYKPTKPTAIAFAIALELDLEQTNDLIGRAGYTLTRSSKFDMIIMYFIQNHNYNMFDINETLYEFDQILLGA